MAASERILFQSYSTGMRRAEKAIVGGHAVGAHVVRVLADAEAGDYGEPYLAALGTVPDSE